MNLFQDCRTKIQDINAIFVLSKIKPFYAQIVKVDTLHFSTFHIEAQL